MKNLFYLKVAIWVILWLLAGVCIQAQKNVSLIGGAGIPEFLFIGARYQMDQVQMGGSYGYGGHDLYSLTADFLYHFRKDSKLSTRKEWYFKLGLSHVNEKNEYTRTKTTTLQTRVGKEFNISESIGIGADVGLFFRIFENETVIKPKPNNVWDFNIDLGIFNYILPSLGVYMFYKF